MPDRMTDSMRRAIDETDRRRTVQRALQRRTRNHPQSIISNIDMGLAQILKAEYGDVIEEEVAGLPDFVSQVEVDRHIAMLESDMREAAKRFEFEKGRSSPRPD